MREFQSTVSKILKDHKKNKRYLAFLLALSMIVSVAVPFSLIMPAVSMTHGEEVPQEDGSDGITLASPFGRVMSLSAPDSGQYPGALEISKSNADNCEVTITDGSGEFLYGGDLGQNPNLSYGEITSDKLDLGFDLTYDFSDKKNYFDFSANKRYMYIPTDSLNGNLVFAFIAVNENGKGEITDADYFDYGGSGIAGTFTFANGYILIELNEDYIAYINRADGGGAIHGTLSFEGELSRSNDADNEQIITVAGAEVPVKFQEKNPTLSKWSNVNNSDGTITWTVTINNENGLDLSNYTLEDEMLGDAKEVTISPNVGTHNGSTITFNSDTRDTSVTITYKTDITIDQLKGTDGSRTNTAKLKKPGKDDITTTSNVNISWRPITVEKTGKADYQNGKPHNDKIDWEIKVKSEHGTSLNGYIIEDANIPSNGVEITPAGVTLVQEGTAWKLNVPDNVTASEVIIKYQADIDPDPNDGNQTKNIVKVKYPDGEPVPDGEKEAKVEYKKKSDLIGFNKSGNYNADTHEITWTIKVTPEDGFSLKGYELHDSKFKAGEVTVNHWGNSIANQVTVSDGKLVFNDNCNVTSGEVIITYKEKIENLPAEGSTSIVSNDIGDNNHTETTVATVPVAGKRNEFSKSLSGSTSETVTNNKDITKTLNWIANITLDDSLAGKVYKDTLRATGDGVTHILNADSIVVKAKKEQYGQESILTKETDYFVSQNGDSFEIRFADNIDAGYNYVTINYSTTATAAEPANADFTEIKYTFSNKGEFNGKTDDDNSFGLTRGNPNKTETMDLGVGKNWSGDETNVNERPDTVYFKLKYCSWNSGNDNDWNYVKKSGNDYLFSGDSRYDSTGDYMIPVSGNDWNVNLTGLPKEVTKANADGSQGATTYYYYKLEEVDASGNPISYIKKTNGIYEVGSSNVLNYTGNLSITNTYYKNIDITAKKNWSGDDDNISNRKPITVELWRSTVQGNWDGHEVIGTQVLNDANNWTYTGWNNLPVKDIQNGQLVTYYYILVETKFGDTSISENNNIILLDNGYYNSAIKSQSTTTGGEITVTNTFHKNIDITVNKNWTDKNNQTLATDKIPVSNITVQLKQSINNGDWENYGSPVTINRDNWNHTFTNLPTKINNNGTIKDCKYKVEEIKFGDNDVSGKNSVTVTNGYFEISNSSDINYTGTLTITNKFYETESLEIDAKKVWNDTDHSDNRPTAIILALQKSANYGNWETIEEQTLNVSGDEQAYSWSGTVNGTQLVSQNSDGSEKYRYRVIEIGYIHDGKTYKFPESEWDKKPTFATKENDGSYEGTYKIGYNDGNVLESSGEVTITNTFSPLETLEITPQKKWIGDEESNRPANVTLRLQQKLGNGEWTDAKDASGNVIEVTLQSNPDTNTVETEWGWDNENQQSIEISTVAWNGAKISNLPKQKIVTTETENADGTFTKISKSETCSYRFVEVVDGNKLGDGDSFRVSGGMYKVTLQSNDVNYSSVYAVTNTYEKYVGITKHAYDGEGIELPSSIDKEDFEKWKEEGKLIKDTFDGEEYYIFNWMVKYDLEDWNGGYGLPTVRDHLPDDFTLCEDTSYLGSQPSSPDQKWGGYWWVSGYSESTGFEYVMNNKFTKGYIEHPSIIYPDVKYACGGMPAESIDFIYEKVMANNNDIFSANPDFWYYYDKENNDVYFNKYKATAESRVWYAIKIKCSVLEEKIAKGTYVIENTAYTYDDNSQDKNKRTPTGQTTGSLTIVNKAPSNLITKDYKSQSIPGYIGFSLDVNPEGKNLSNGDTIDIEDIFKTDSYLDQHVVTPYHGENLVDVLMNNIRLYKVDANGNKTPLEKNEYVLNFESNENGVANRDSETGEALLKLTIPDETHIVIDYVYKLIANNKTPSVINGCKSSTRVQGRYPVMAPGMVPPAGDEITFTNKAKLYSDSASADDSVKEQKYEISKSSGTISTNTLPKVKKVDVGNYGINNLEAKFLLARYDQSQQKWFYATEINQGEEITKWSEGVTGLTVAEGAVQINVDTNYSYQLSLNKDSLYKLVEVKVPDGYEGSNLGLSDTEFEELIVNYLNTGATTFKNKDYSVFLKNYVPVYYFVYNSVMNSYPDNIKASDVIQVKSGGNIEIPNNQLIDIDVTKNWNDGNESKKNDEVEVTLYWSHTKTSTGMPSDAKIATRDDLGLMDENFSAVQTAKTGENKKVWENLPNGKDGKPIYYYIKETSYTIGDKTYELDKKTGVYKNGTEEGRYLPTYVGNAANTDSVITVNNSQQLMLKKVWKNASNNPLSANKIPTESIIVDIYGTTKLDVEEKLFEGIEITKDDNWECDITKELEDKDISLADYKSFRAEESGFDTTGYVVSCVFNLNADTGEITITNKSTVATEASATVNKVWSDGEAIHEEDEIKITLYQSASEIKNIAGLTQEALEKALQDANAKPMKKISSEDTQVYQDVVLNAENEWTYTWTGLPLDDGSEDNPKSYYYYVVEDMSGMTNGDKYTATYTAMKSGAKTTYTVKNTRQAIVVQKQWFDEDGEQIVDIYDEDGNLVIDNTGNLPEIQLKVYKQTSVDKPNPLVIHTFGDSITQGSSYNQSNATYASNDYLKQLLESSKYGSFKVASFGWNGSDSTNTSQGGQEINYLSGKSLNEYDNVICMMIGTNNVIHKVAYGESNKEHDLKEQIKTLFADAKDKPLFLASIPNFNFVDDFIDYYGSNLILGQDWFSGYYSEAGFNQYNDKSNVTKRQALQDYVNNTLVVNYNNYVKSVCAELLSDGYNVIFVDVNAVIDESKHLYDGCHLNTQGVAKMAEAFAGAINNYYTVSDADTEQIVTLNQANNWTAVVDVPDDENYHIEEVNIPNGWEVRYPNTTGLKPGTATAIVAENKKQEVPKTRISVEKTWVGDSADTTKRDGISFSLMRKTSNTDWEEIAVDMPEPQMVGDVWTYVYEELPAKDNLNQTYYYKVIEDDLDGYKATYDSNYETGLQAVENGNAGTLKITNTRLISLKLKKVWANESDKQGKVTVDIYRSTNPDDVPKENVDLILKVPETASVGVGKDITVKANKLIASVKSDNPDIATVASSGQEIIIRGVADGTAQITVTDEKGDTAVIRVTVSALEMFLNNGKIFEIEAGTSGTLSAKLSGNAVSNVTFSSNNDSVLSINGSEITAHALGSAIITATYNDISIEQEIVVILPSTFEITGESEVTIDGTLQLGVDKEYGTFTWSSSNSAIARVDENTGVVTGISAGEVIITATRNDGKVVKKTITVKNGDIFANDHEDLALTVRIGDTITLPASKGINGIYNYDTAKISAKSEQKDGTTYLVITGLGIGETTFTIQSGQGGGYQNKSMSVRVIDKFSVSPATKTLLYGESVTLTPNMEGDIQYSVKSGSNLVTLSGNTVTAKSGAEGTAVIEAKNKSTGETATITINVVAELKVVEQDFNSATEINFDKNQSISSVVLYLNDSNAGSWPYLVLRFNDGDANKVKVGYSGSVPLVIEDNSSTFTNIEAVLNDDKHSVTITFKNGWQPDKIAITDHQSNATGKVTIEYGSSTFSLRSIATNNLASDIMMLADGTALKGELIRTVDITATTGWETAVEELDVYDNDGRPYYYWVVERVDENSAGYDVSYSFEDNDDNTDYCINSGNLGAGTVTVRNTKQESQGVAMPSTGGQGVGGNYATGVILMGSSTAAYILIKRRKKKAS